MIEYNDSYIGTAARPSVAVVAFLAVFGTSFGTTAYISGLIKLHRTWTLIQPLRLLDPSEAGMPTPGQSVALFLIPFYGWFAAVHSLAKRVNKYINITGSSVVPLNEKLILAICILNLAWFVPCFGQYSLLATIPLVGYLVIELDRVRRELILENDQIASLQG